MNDWWCEHIKFEQCVNEFTPEEYDWVFRGARGLDSSKWYADDWKLCPVCAAPRPSEPKTLEKKFEDVSCYISHQVLGGGV